MAHVRLDSLAHARSGDKGSHANIAVIARSPAAYDMLRDCLTREVVARYFAPLGVEEVTRYELPNLHAFNFMLRNVLAGGASRSLRSDAQGKALAQALLAMELDLPDAALSTTVEVLHER